MPRQALPLTDAKLRSLRAHDKPVSSFDGKGLFILCTPNGGRWWRFKYRFAAKTKTLSFGTYPEVSLKEAREKRDQARELLAKGIDPSEARKEQKRILLASSTKFSDVFDEWLDVQTSKLAKGTVEKIRSSMTNHALPKIGGLPIDEVKVEALLSMLRSIEEKGALEMARRVRAWASRVFRYAIVTGRCERDPATDLRGALRVPSVKHHAALATIDLPAFIKALDDPLARIAPLTRLHLSSDCRTRS